MSLVKSPKNSSGKHRILRETFGALLCILGVSLYLYPIFESKIGNISLGALVFICGLALILSRPKSDAEEAEQFILRKKD